MFNITTQKPARCHLMKTEDEVHNYLPALCVRIENYILDVLLLVYDYP